MPRTTYLLNPEQRSYLHAIQVKANRVKKSKANVDRAVQEFQDMIVHAKAMGIPYTRISKFAGLSPERLSQIDKERKPHE